MTPAIAPGTRVLLTGATGFTGAVLARKLVGLDLSVAAIARPSSNVEPLRDLRIEWFRGSVYDPAIVERAAAGAVFVFHLAAAYRDAGIDDLEYRRVHATSTEFLAAAARRDPAFRRFVHVSTVGVHGHIESPPAGENHPFAPGDVYQATKAEAELWLHRYAADTGLPYTVIRPAAIYGPGDRRLLKVFRMAARPVFFVLGHGRCLYHLIHVDDLTDAILLAATHPSAAGEAFICGSPSSMTLPGIAATVATALGRSTRIVRLPAQPFFLAADLCERMCRPLGIAPPIYRRRVAFFTKDRSFDTRKIRERLGFETRHTDEAGLTETAQWYRAHGWL